MTLYTPDSLSYDLWRQRIAVSDTFRAMLLGSSYTFNTGAHSRRSDVVASEIAATGGYTAGGVAVTISDSLDTTQHAHILTLSLASIGTGPITAQYVAYVKWRGGAATADELIAVLNLGRTITSDGAFIVPAQTIKFAKF